MKRWAMGLLVLAGSGLGLVSLAADFNGDGIGDIAIFRYGLWAVRNVTRVYLGGSGDEPVPGDYNGSGIDRPAIFRDGAGLWAVRDLTRVTLGSTGDQPVVGDYEGDGADDIAIFRPGSGMWLARAITRVYFGLSRDRAIAPGKAMASKGLSWTGQTTVYRTGDDGDHQAGSPFRYEIVGSSPQGVVIDHKTALTWAQDGYGEGGNWGQMTNWNAAIDWCNNMVFAGYDDWRLPNAKELQSIVDYGTDSPAIDTTYFINTKLGPYWSSTTYDSNSSYAWFVSFGFGEVHQVNKVCSGYVRAVRGGE